MALAEGVVADKLKFGSIEMRELAENQKPPKLSDAWKVWHGVREKRLGEKGPTDIYVALMRDGKINYHEHGTSFMAIDAPVQYTPRVDLVFNPKPELVLIKNVSDTADVKVQALTKNLANFLKNKVVKEELGKLDEHLANVAAKNIEDFRTRRFM
jgi:hypothetical protein